MLIHKITQKTTKIHQITADKSITKIHITTETVTTKMIKETCDTHRITIMAPTSKMHPITVMLVGLTLIVIITPLRLKRTATTPLCWPSRPEPSRTSRFKNQSKYPLLRRWKEQSQSRSVWVLILKIDRWKGKRRYSDAREAFSTRGKGVWIGTKFARH